MERRRAALIEIDGSHDECLYAQLLFLQRLGYDASLICSEDLREQVAVYDNCKERIFFNFRGASELEKLRALWNIRKYITAKGIETVIFNSAHGRQIRNLSYLLSSQRVAQYGTLHGINKLDGSGTQWLISQRVRNYFLLNDYLIENLKLVPHKGLRFESYYPIFFPDFGTLEIDKPEDEMWIAIPGQVEAKRRDYERLIRAFAGIAQRPRCKFLLLGNSQHRHSSGDELKALCEELRVRDYFVFWDGFVENREFHGYLKKSDIVMPLIHPGNDGYEKYLRYQITGSYNLAFAYKKPLLMLEAFSGYGDFQENALFYSLDKIAETIENLNVSLADVNYKKYQDTKWTLEAQSARYGKFIGA